MDQCGMYQWAIDRKRISGAYDSDGHEISGTLKNGTRISGTWISGT